MAQLPSKSTAQPQVIEAEVLYRPESAELRFLPEGPQVCGPGRISWVAIQHGPDATYGSLNVLDLATRQNQTHLLPHRVGFAHPLDQEHLFVLGLERQLVRYDLARKTSEPLGPPVETDVTGTIINDGLSFPEGIVFGAKDLKFAEPKAGLYLLRWRDRSITRLRSDQTCSNGKVLQPRPDGSYTLLDIDTPTKTVVRYRLDVERATLTAEGVALDLTQHGDFPDGMVGTPDGQGVIIAFYNPHEAPYGEARHYDLASGRLVTVWRTPGSPQVTCPQLVSWHNERRLVLTTAVEHMPAARRPAAPHAGCLFLAPTPF